MLKNKIKNLVYLFIIFVFLSFFQVLQANENLNFLSLKNKKVNFPILGSVSIATAGIVVLVGWFFFTKSGFFRKPKREIRTKEF